MAVVFDNDDGIIPNGNGANGMESPSEQKTKVWGIDMDTPPTKHSATPKPKTYQDILAYEDKWIGWDGPVWCSRYGRFEKKEDASADDGYSVKAQPAHHDLGLVRCEKHGCDCNVPLQHKSYVQDIQRRVEPMVSSLVRLEHQVGALIHHFKSKEASSAPPAPGTNGHANGNNGHVEGGFAEGLENTPVKHVNHGHDSTLETWIDPALRADEHTEGRFHQLETRVEGLMHQIHQLMIHGGHHVPEKK